MAASIPAHGWVRDGQAEVPALLVAWERRGTEWWGRVAVVVAGEPVVQVVRADMLRPATV